MTDHTIRAFVAIELPEDVRNTLKSTIEHIRGSIASADIKWVPSANIHLTLKFLGRVRMEQTHEVRRRLMHVCEATPPMQLEAHTLGGFPSLRSPRVVWVGLSGDTSPLASLANRIDENLGELGFALETRPFTPHLTLARVRQEASNDTRSALGNAIRESAAVTRIAFAADAVSLMRSELRPGGAVYTRIAHLPLTRSLRAG